MRILFEHITTMREKSWKWFAARAHGKHAVAWLGILSFLEPLISPIVPETLLVAMLLAGSDEKKWKKYSFVTTAWAVAGGVLGYLIGAFFFRGFGEWLLGLTGTGEIHRFTQDILTGGSIFLLMLLITFTPIPDKPFTYLSGFLGAPFLPYFAGFLIGRALRFTTVAYLTHRYGAQVLGIINKYFFWFTIAILALLALYGIVHLHLLPRF